MAPSGNESDSPHRGLELGRALLLAALAAIASYWLTATLLRSHARAPEAESSLAAPRETPDTAGDDEHVGVGGRRDETRDELRRALTRRDALRARVADLELLLEMKAAHDEGVLAPTIRNCALIVGDARMPECPLSFESPEMLRHIAKCGLLTYDVPKHVIDRAMPDADPTWDSPSIDSETRERLRGIDTAFSQSLEREMRSAYADTFEVPAPEGLTVADGLRELLRSDEGRHADWAFEKGARARLGESSDEDISELPPLARFYVHVATAGDRYERALADVLGEEQARALRRSQGGWDAQGVAGGTTRSDECAAEPKARSR
jgi:hypothetical protein